MRSKKRLNEIRALPCVRCGYPHSQAAHSNSGKHGKGKELKPQMPLQCRYATSAISYSTHTN